VPNLSYDTFDPSGCGFVPPRVPLLPTLLRRAGAPENGPGFEVVGAGSPQCTYTRGRYALHDAFRLCGVGPAGGLLAPAYHCRTMIDPAIALGAPVLLYPLDERLRPDLSALERVMDAAAQPVRALLLTHYFGFPQATAPIKALCERRGIVLIEDGSHALFNRRGAGRIGLAGRYVTASPYKLFPCEEGGLLVAREGAVLPQTHAAGMRAEVKVLVDAVQRAWLQRRSGVSVPDVEDLDAELKALGEAPMPLGAQHHRSLDGPSGHYDPREHGLAAAHTSGALRRLCDVDQLAARRRFNYRRWVDAVRALPDCRALFEDLPEDCVPYMFPLLLGGSQARFHLLKRLGVPIWRWDDMAASDCAVSARYRLQLLHLPCHQSLSEGEMAWMIRAVAAVSRLDVRV
jgi:perosamine synthetase